MRICKTKDTKVTAFTTKKIYERVQTYLKNTEEYEIILKEDNETISHFLNRVETICNEKIDLLFVNTIQMSTIRVAPYLGFKPKCKMILTIHMVNHWLKQKIAFNPRHLLRSGDVSCSILLVHRFILPKYDAINVIYSPLKEYIQENTDFKKPVFTLPFNFYNGAKSSKKDNKIKFVVPGLIETYRRDYDLTLDVFEDLFKKYGKKIQLTLLGKPVGKGGNKIIERCEVLRKKGYDVSFSKGFIPEQEYDKILTEKNVIFSPLNIETKRESGIIEIYGKTEGSALPFEAIQYCKPLIVPQEFNIIKEMKSSTLQYKSSEDLEKILEEIIENKDKLDKLSKEACKNSEKFSLPVLQEYFTRKILDKIDSL